MQRASVAAALIVVAGLPAGAAPPLRDADRDRLERYEQAAGDALLQALAKGAADDVAQLSRALSGTPIPPTPSGDWKCRTMKLGGLSGLVVYTDFDCRITGVGPTEWTFEKLTGSQRTRGSILFENGRAIYRGVGFAGGDAPAVDYAALPDTQETVEPNQTHPQVAVFEQTSPSSARLTFPYPMFESDFDVLYLTR